MKILFLLAVLVVVLNQARANSLRFFDQQSNDGLPFQIPLGNSNNDCDRAVPNIVINIGVLPQNVGQNFNNDNDNTDYNGGLPPAIPDDIDFFHPNFDNSYRQGRIIDHDVVPNEFDFNADDSPGNFDNTNQNSQILGDGELPSQFDFNTGVPSNNFDENEHLPPFNGEYDGSVQNQDVDGNDSVPPQQFDENEAEQSQNVDQSNVVVPNNPEVKVEESDIYHQIVPQ